MSIFSMISGLFTSAEALQRDVDDVAPRSSRAGRPQKCSVCHIEGHKAPSHAPGKIFALQARVGNLQQQVEEAKYLLGEMTDIARFQQERAEIAEGQVREFVARVEELSQELAGMKQQLADVGAAAGPYIYGEPTSI